MFATWITSAAIAIYRGAGTLATPWIRRHLKQRAARGREDPDRLPERLGRASLARPAGRLVWLHASSVGESLSLLALIDSLQRRWPATRLLLTTGTVTSARLMAERLPADVLHQYVPIDQPAAVRRFYDHWQPDLGLIVESELWPNLLLSAQERRLPLVLINGRISAQSHRNWGRARHLIRRLLACFALVIAQSPEDQARFKDLGATDCRYLGNLKFAAAPLAAQSEKLAAVEAALAGRPRWLAASTHPGEEAQIGRVHHRLAAGLPDMVTLIVPRHPQRGPEVAALLQNQDLSVALQSRGEGITGETQIYVADSLGEMGLWYRIAELVFVGNSLGPKGGHNPLEPARLNCAVLIGPHSGNFAQITADMQAAGALRQVADAVDLSAALLELMQNPEASRTLAQAGRRFAASQSEVLQAIVEAIAPILESAGADPDQPRG